MMKDEGNIGKTKNRLLEVIVTTVEDAVAAESGGAGRLEVISNFAAGGLTPAIELVRKIQTAVSIPLRVMLRAHEGFEITHPEELEILCRDAESFAALGVEGLVLGFLHQGEIDFATVQSILNCAPNLKATFHRAFEVLQNPFPAIEALKQCKQIDRILTSGGKSDWQQNVLFLKALQKCAEPELTILIGGGLDLSKVEELCREPELREFHLGRALRKPEQVDGEVCVGKVKKVVEILR